MISFLAAFLDQRRMSEARKAAAAPRGPRTNAVPRAAQSGGNTLRCNSPAKLRPAAQLPSCAARRTASTLRCNRPMFPAPPRSHHHPARRGAKEAASGAAHKQSSTAQHSFHKPNPQNPSPQTFPTQPKVPFLPLSPTDTARSAADARAPETLQPDGSAGHNSP